MSYSLILPVFNEANTINTLFKRISKIMDQQRSEYELIFINDGSTDATNQLLTTLHQQYPLVKIISDIGLIKKT